MSSHSDAVSRIVLEFPANRRSSAARAAASKSSGPFAALASYVELIATHCLSVARPLRVGWPAGIASQLNSNSENEPGPNAKKVRVTQIQDLVVLTVLRAGRRAG